MSPTHRLRQRREAVSQGAQLILFPEMCVTGYVSSDDETDDDSRMCIEAAEGPDAHAYNSAFVCTWGSYASDPEAIDLVTAEIDYSDL